MSAKITGTVLVVIGLLVVLLSRTIVFPGLEMALGIETIVGRENVSYQPDGSYYYTNPGAMVRWIASVAGAGLVVMALGVATILRARRRGGNELTASPNGGSAIRPGNSGVGGKPPSAS